MDFCKRDNCNSISEKNVVIKYSGEEAVAGLELCRKDCYKSGVLHGKIINQFGQPIDNAIVKIVSQSYEPIFYTKTDCNGNYFISNIPLNRVFKVMAMAEKHRLSEEIKFYLKEQKEFKVNISLSCNEYENAGVVAGSVFNRLNFLPINEAQVLLYEEKRGGMLLKNITSTNEFGQFIFTRLELGTYLVKICMNGYIGGKYPVNITQCGQIANRVVSLCPSNNGLKGTVSGVITDSYQRPVPEADVILYRVENNSQTTPIAYTRTNSEGVYLFINVETGSYRVSAI